MKAERERERLMVAVIVGDGGGVGLARVVGESLFQEKWKNTKDCGWSNSWEWVAGRYII